MKYFIPHEKFRETLRKVSPSGLRDLEETLRRGTMVELHCPLCGDLHLSELRFMSPFSPCPRCSTPPLCPNGDRRTQKVAKPTAGEIKTTVLFPLIRSHPLSFLFLGALARSLGHGCELMVVLAGEKAASHHFMEQISCKLLESPRGTSLPAALNQALLEGSGEYLAVVREDVLVRPDWLPPLVAALKGDPRAAAASSLVLDSRGYIYHAGYRLNRAPKGNPLLVPLRKGERTGVDGGAKRVPALALHCAVLRRDLALEIGPFDEGYPYPGTYADVDWTFRVRLAGYHSLVIGASRAMRLDTGLDRKGLPWDEASKHNLKILLERWTSKEGGLVAHNP